MCLYANFAENEPFYVTWCHKSDSFVKKISGLNCGISLALHFSFAVKTDGTLWSWGDNSNGQLGVGNTTYYSSPKQVGSLTNWLNTACGYRSTISIKTDGTLWSWGGNGQGQLGIGNTTAYSSPKQVGNLTTWATITSGDNHALAA